MDLFFLEEHKKNDDEITENLENIYLFGTN